MSAAALRACLARHHAHAAMTFRLDEELGTQHGLAWADFVLLEVLEEAGGALATTVLAARLGTAPSRLLLQVLPLERCGLLSRSAVPGAPRQVTLRPAARQLLRDARETAAAVCGMLAAA